MSWEAWLAVIAIIGMLIALARGWGTSDLVVWFTLGVLVLAGVVTGSKLLPTFDAVVANMGNSGLVTVGLLFIVVEGLIRTGATTRLSEPLLRLRYSKVGLQLPLFFAVAAGSAFLNNTAIVAMFLPIVHDLSRRTGTAPSRLFLPMCYAATLGGVCTVMGTSTNLVVTGLMTKADMPVIGVFELAWVGVPVMAAGVLYMVIASRFLLPDRRPPVSLSDDPREYSVEMEVDPQGVLVGRTVEDAGLRHLPGLYLIEIQRGGNILAAVSHHERLQANDRLVFVGVVDSVVDLRRIRGLLPTAEARFHLDERPGRCLIEVVVSPDCPLLGQTVRESNFRSVYEAAVIAAARRGERIQGKLGDVVLTSGDTLLLETHPEFMNRYRHHRGFFLVSPVENSTVPSHGRGWIALAIIGLMIGSVAIGITNLAVASLVAALATILTGCCTATQAREAVEWSVLLVIGAALGIAGALESTGAAEAIAGKMVGLAGAHPWSILAMVYLATLICTELITNNAAAALMFPIAVGAAKSIGVNPIPFAVAVMVAASCGFATPFGYQTNLMVAGPGGYKFGDYVRFGGPLDLVAMLVALLLIPLVWKF